MPQKGVKMEKYFLNDCCGTSIELKRIFRNFLFSHSVFYKVSGNKTQTSLVIIVLVS